MRLSGFTSEIAVTAELIQMNELARVHGDFLEAQDNLPTTLHEVLCELLICRKTGRDPQATI